VVVVAQLEHLGIMAMHVVDLVAVVAAMGMVYFQ
jgi:hypothetical protein